MGADDQLRDHLPTEEDGMQEGREFGENLKSRSTWIRLLFMLIVIALLAVSRLVVFPVVALQFLWVLFTAEANERLTAFGHSLALYTCEIIDYLTYNTDDKPFPFDNDWP